MAASTPDISDIFNMSQGLHGYLRVPKDGKVRKGWKQQWAILRELKVYIYDNEEAMEMSNGVFCFDVTSDIFHVSTVTQKEVIHASSKDIDSIFKIVSSSVLPTRRTLKQDPNVKKLAADIKIEENIIAAKERILAITQRLFGICPFLAIAFSTTSFDVLKH